MTIRAIKRRAKSKRLGRKPTHSQLVKQADAIFSRMK